MPTRIFITTGALLCALALAAGAFGAHALKTVLSIDQLVTYDTAVRYQFIHGFGLFVAAWAAERCTGHLAAIAGGLFVLGTLLFSGSLYLIAITGWRGIGYLTPIGGLALLGGWLCLAGATRRWKSPSNNLL